jgi:D-alanyl-D-alanine dipeptidase
MKKTYGLLVFSIMLNACGADRQASPVPAPESGPQPAAAARNPVLPSQDTLPPQPTTGDTEVVKPDRPKGKPVKPSAPTPKPAAAEKSETSKSAPAIPLTARAGENGFVDIQALDATIRLDIRYATANNFTSAKIYDCARCLLRLEAAAALQKAHRALKRQGLGLKMFDCYRPRPYQQRLWDKVPNPDYVTPPEKGSMHSRGAAVDLTIVDAQGNELDMGTPYDFFGREAHYDYTRLPGKVLANRRLLRRTMEAAGFQGIRTEWWHFSFKGKNYPLSDFVWECD